VFFRRHPTLGYSHIPGRVTVALDSSFSFAVTHAADTLRITHPIDGRDASTPRDEIWIFGGSFTHGWSLDDDETYPWLLQARFPEYEIVNFGVSGYGTIHSLIQFREALETRTPKVAILAYARFHDARNTFLRNRRKGIAPWNRLGPLVQPFARLDRNGRLNYGFADVVYTEFPMMRRSALAHFIEMQYNQLEARWYRSHDVSKALVKDMAALAARHGVTFIVVNISRGGAMLDVAASIGLPHVDMSVDRSLPENTNLPHDGHPSAVANRTYADTLEPVLRDALSR
jgi:hypothetical protein